VAAVERWEYFAIFVQWGLVGGGSGYKIWSSTFRDVGRVDGMTNILDTVAKNGWELVNIIQPHNPNESYTFIF
jgi:hypothetical protein